MEHNPTLPWYRKLHWQVLMAMIAGALFATFFPEGVAYVGWVGTLFMRALKMIVVPLVLTSITTGVASLGGHGLGRMFSKTLGYYMLSSALAIIAGLLMVNLIQPGVGADLGSAAVEEVSLTTPDSPVELLYKMVPENVVQAIADSNMLGMIFFAILLGMAIGTLPSQHRGPLATFFESAFEAMMKVTGWVIQLLPIGIFGLIAVAVNRFSPSDFAALGKYALTIAAGLLIHLFITLPLLLILLGRIKPTIHFRNMIEPLIMAFSTSSSAATLPVTMRTVEKKVGVSNRTASFVLPMGATVNMDGTALYECAGALFIAQVMGAQLGLVEQGTVVLVALLASIGAAAVPSAGLVVIFIVLGAVGLEGPEVDLIVGAMLAIDRPLDMFRTSVNVFSHSCGAAIIARSEGEHGVDEE
jgi:Na+/H+-dicarboxylate symporter